MNHEQSWFSHINWRRESIFPALALAETCLITPWVLALLPIGNQNIPPEHAAGVCLAIILGTLYLVRAMEALRVHTLIQRAVVLFGLIGLSVWALRLLVFNGPEWTDGEWQHAPFQDTIALSDWLPGATLVVLGMAGLCWRGLRLAQRPLSVIDMMMGFQIGVLVFVLLALMSTEHEITLFVPPFFFSQLLAIGLARVEMIAQLHGGRRPPLDGWWLAVLVGSTGMVVTLAGAINAVVFGLDPDKLWLWARPFIAIVALPIMLLMLPIVVLLEGIAKALANPIASVITQLLTLLNQLQAWLRQSTRLKPPPITYAVLRVIEYGIGILIVLVVLAALIRVAQMVGRRRASQASKEGEEYESIWSSRALLQKLRAQLLHRLSRLKNLADIAGRFGAGGLFTALTIRRIYAQTVRLAASRGYPRPLSRTPYEHLATLQQAVPGCDAEMSQITEAYVSVHYGELPEHPEALSEIRIAFERVKETSRQGDKETRGQGDRVTRTDH